VLFNIRDRQLAGAPARVYLLEAMQRSPKTGWTGLISFNDRCRDFGELREVILQAMEIVPVADIAHRADKAAVSRAVVELAFDPAFAVVEKFDQQVEHVHGFCGTVGVARHDCGS
jgi:hypothetical protein